MLVESSFEATDAAGSRLSIREGPEGGAFVALGEGGNLPVRMFLRPEAVRRLRDWCDRALEGAKHPTLADRAVLALPASLMDLLPAWSSLAA